jgi:Ni,Fe-hydrogenase I small subunit
MNTNDGNIRSLGVGEKPMPNEVLLSQIEADYLKMLKASERPQAFKDLRSHNNSKRRKSVRRMQKLSQRKNRK